MVSKLPLLNKPFKEQSLVAKLSYIATAITTIGGAIVLMWQGVAFANDKLDGKVIRLVNENAYEAVALKVSGEFKKLHERAERSRITQQISTNRMESRFIKSEINDITRNAGDSLNASEQAEVETLRDDRNAILIEVKELKEQLQQIDE